MKISPFSWLTGSFFGYFIVFGVFVPFFPTWLQANGYSAEVIGFILAAVYLFRFSGVMILSSRIKRADQILPALRLFAWLSFALMIAIGLSVSHLPLLIVMIALFAMVNSMGIPLGDTLATVWQQQIKLDYGKVRQAGSFAYALGVVLFGFLISWLGELNIVWVLTALLFAYALVQMATPRILVRNERESADKKTVLFRQLLRDPMTCRFLLAAGLILGSHAAYYSYSVLYWTSIGISMQATSLLWGFSVIAEIAVFFFATRLFKNWTVSKLFIFAAGCAVARWLAFAYGSNLWIITPFQFLHCITFAVTHYAMMRYISTQPQAHIAKLQALYNGIASTGITAILTLLTGQLYPYSPTVVFIVMAICAFAAIWIVPRQSAVKITRN